MSSDLLGPALLYANRNWSVFPVHWPMNGRCSCGKSDCQSPAKHPLTEHGHHDATTDPKRIEEYWTKWPNANIAVVTGKLSGIVVLDVDPRTGGDGSLRELEQKYGKLPHTVETKTGGGGRHLLFAHPGFPVGNSAGKLAPGLDIRGDGGYFIAPGSVHSSGQRYEFEVSCHPDDVPLAPLPVWFLNLLSGHNGHNNPQGWISEALAGLEEGNRNDTFTRVIGKLHREKWTPDDILAILQPHAEICSFPINELEREIRGICERYETPNPDDEAKLINLAKLSSVEYDRSRVKEAEKLGIRVSTLDSEVARLRDQSGIDKGGQGLDLRFEDPDPWEEPVDGASLLGQIKSVFERFLILPEGAATAQTLWVILTFVFDAFEVSPYLLVSSPEKRCGKTRNMRILSNLVARPLPASNVTSAALFRTVEKEHPTLLIDEADSFLPDNEELRGIINSGHSKDFSFVIRTAGENHEPRHFSTWCPKAIALIGKAQPTIEDRSIVIGMRRKRPDEKITGLKIKSSSNEFIEIRRKVIRWVNDNLQKLAEISPRLPNSLGDRERDKWEPLFAIAEAIGGEWPQQVQLALESLGSNQSSGESHAVQLLSDLRDMFSREKKDRLFSENIVSKLSKMEERPWPEWSKGKPITTRQLASLLKRFSVSPRSVRIGEETAKGYLRENLEDAFSRYLPPCDPSQPSQSSIDVVFLAENDPSQSQDVTDQKSPASLYQTRFVTDVTDEKVERGQHSTLVEQAVEIFKPLEESLREPGEEG